MATLSMELAELVIDELCNDKAALKKCILVSPLWQPRAYHYLFHTIDVRIPIRFERLLSVLKDKPSLGRYIRNLSLSGESQVEAWFRDELPGDPTALIERTENVEVLSISRITWSALYQDVRMRLLSETWGHSVKKLVLCDCTLGSDGDLLTFLRGFPQLCDLELIQMCWDSPPSIKDAEAGPKVRLKRLDMTFFSQENGYGRRGFLAGLDLGNLNTLILTMEDEHDVGAANSILKQTAGSLEHMCISNIDKAPFLPEEGFSQLSNLKTYALFHSSTSHSFSWDPTSRFVDVMSLIPSKSIATVSLWYNPRRLVAFQNANWERFRSIATRRSWTNPDGQKFPVITLFLPSNCSKESLYACREGLKELMVSGIVKIVGPKLLPTPPPQKSS